ncbi:MAG: hypothetical protein KatS3mg003_0647 [Candidatus Nitrosocaldaceae archaeon]|nr:MAG: hypothetical protein KatS3mg003_0647 [Candidatus Nitrosocaldaceae archaeon]
MSNGIDSILERIIEAIMYYGQPPWCYDIIPLSPCSKKPIKGFKWRIQKISAEELIEKIRKGRRVYNIALRLGYYNGYGRIVIDFDYIKDKKELDNRSIVNEYLKSGNIKPRRLEEAYNLIEDPKAAKNRLDKFFALIKEKDQGLYEKIRYTTLVETSSKGYHIYLLVKCTEEEFKRFENKVWRDQMR